MQVSIKKLKEIHTLTHPGKVGPTPRGEWDEVEEASEADVFALLAEEEHE